jgi:ABC-type branched-subunit amino acid transport system permease subunit
MRTGNYKESVGQIIALSDSKAVWGWTAALIAALIVAPYLVGAYALTLMVSALIAVIGAVGLNLLTGTTGLISLGQAGFLAVGAYTNAILLTDYHLPVWLSLPPPVSPVRWSALSSAFRPCASRGFISPSPPSHSRSSSITSFFTPNG